MISPKETIANFDPTNIGYENDDYGDMGYDNYGGEIFGGGFSIGSGGGGRGNQNGGGFGGERGSGGGDREMS